MGTDLSQDKEMGIGSSTSKRFHKSSGRQNVDDVRVDETGLECVWRGLP